MEPRGICAAQLLTNRSLSDKLSSDERKDGLLERNEDSQLISAA